MIDARAFLTFAVLQFLSYLNLTINYRAIAHEQYAFAMVSDGIACLFSYTIVKRIQRNESRAGVVGMTLGGMCAAVVGMWLTRTWG